MCRRPGIAPRCAAGAHPSRTADCRAVRRICDATAPRRGSARRPRSPGTASGGVWQNPRRRLGTGRQPAHAGDRVCRAEQGHPGALSADTAAATAIAQHLAITNCWLGATVGAWYYAVFPVAASAGLVAATTGAMLAAIGVVTALAWIVLDPLLATTGIHRRRPDRFVTALGEELRGGRRGAYRVRDHYLARVFDVLDLLRAATKALS